MWLIQPAQTRTGEIKAQTHTFSFFSVFKHFNNKSNLPLIFMVFSFLGLDEQTSATWGQCKEAEKKNRKENNSVNVNGLNSSFSLPYRSIKLEQNKRVRQVSPVLISSPSARAHRQISDSSFVFCFFAPFFLTDQSHGEGALLGPPASSSAPAFLSVYPANLLSPSVDSHMISLPTAPPATRAWPSTRGRVLRWLQAKCLITNKDT